MGSRYVCNEHEPTTLPSAPRRILQRDFSSIQTYRHSESQFRFSSMKREHECLRRLCPRSSCGCRCTGRIHISRRQQHHLLRGRSSLHIKHGRCHHRHSASLSFEQRNKTRHTTQDKVLLNRTSPRKNNTSPINSNFSTSAASIWPLARTMVAATAAQSSCLAS